MTTQHTPGPWVVDEDPRPGMEWNRQIMTPSRNTAICFMAHSAGAKPTQDEFNARLIAAAPELLAAVEDLLNGWKYIRSMHGDLYGVGWDRAQGKADAAIAKATGEPT